MIISARSPDCIHSPSDARQPASACITCPIDNPEYQRWCEFWDALPYAWQWDKPERPGDRFYGGHWEVRATGERVTGDLVESHLRGMGVTVVRR